MFVIGVDIGGMSIKAGIVDSYGNIIFKSRIPTPKKPEDAISGIVKQINNLISSQGLSIDNISGIGIGCPGSVNDKQGVIQYANNLEWHNVPLKAELAKYFPVKIEINNDANVATLAEVKYGVAKNYSSAIMLTLGTGVGGGIVIDNKIFSGSDGLGAELGHHTLILGGNTCTCGRKGCFEVYASATALINQTKKAMLEDKDSIMWEYSGNSIDKVDGKTAFECAKLNDSTAIKVRDKYIEYLGEGIINMLNIFRPEVIIIGGGISAQGDYLISLVKEYLKKEHYGYACVQIDILIAKLGNDAGIIGAAALI